MGDRKDLDDMLRETLGTNHVYFQPPENLRMNYPCIEYSRSGNYIRHANNKTYHHRREYSMTYITYDPDDPMIETLEDLPYCSMGRPYTAENLHHYPYTIYF